MESLWMRKESKTKGQSIIEEKIRTEDYKMGVRKYLCGRYLGKGGFAKCYEITNLETNKVSAVKLIPKSSLVDPDVKSNLMTEINIHKDLLHPKLWSSFLKIQFL